MKPAEFERDLIARAVRILDRAQSTEAAQRAIMAAARGAAAANDVPWAHAEQFAFFLADMVQWRENDLRIDGPPSWAAEMSCVWSGTVAAFEAEWKARTGKTWGRTKSRQWATVGMRRLYYFPGIYPEHGLVVEEGAFPGTRAIYEVQS